MAFHDHGFEKFQNKIWLASPTMHGDELLWMTDAYKKNWMTTAGENVNELERMVAKKIGCGYAVALSSGTSALHLAVKLAGIGRGDRVLCSDMTFAATLNPVVYEGAEPIFIDTEYDTWNMDPAALERAFTLYPDAKAVVLANLYGTPGKMDQLIRIAHAHGALVIEDAAESFGATYKGKQTGIFGDIGVISFNGNKIITGSSGGMLLTDDASSAERARKWSTQSREAAPWYQHEEIGYNYRMSNVIAGVARGQMPYLEEHIAKKKAIYTRYREGLRGLPVTMNPYDSDIMEPNFWLSCILIDRAAMCRQTRGALAADYTPEPGRSCPTEILETLARYNIEGRPIWKPMHMQPIYQNHFFVTRSASAHIDAGADIFDRGLCLPSDIKMTEEEQGTVIDIIRACFD